MRHQGLASTRQTGPLDGPSSHDPKRYSASDFRTTAIISLCSRFEIVAPSFTIEPWKVPGNRCNSTLTPEASIANALATPSSRKSAVALSNRGYEPAPRRPPSARRRVLGLTCLNRLPQRDNCVAN